MKSSVLHGAYVARFFTSEDDPPIFHTIITKQGSRAILDWIQSRVEEDCERQAARVLRELSGIRNTNLLLSPQAPPRSRKLKNPRTKWKRA